MTNQQLRLIEVGDTEDLLAIVLLVADPARGELALNSYLEPGESDRDYNEVEVRKMIQGLRDQADLLEGRLQLELDLKELTDGS